MFPGEKLKVAFYYCFSVFFYSSLESLFSLSTLFRCYILTFLKIVLFTQCIASIAQWMALRSSLYCGSFSLSVLQRFFAFLARPVAPLEAAWWDGRLSKWVRGDTCCGCKIFLLILDLSSNAASVCHFETVCGNSLVFSVRKV